MVIKTKRSCLIVKEDIGNSFSVHNGKSWVTVKIIEGMENDFFGAYVTTKKLGTSIHKIRKVGKKKKNK